MKLQHKILFFLLFPILLPISTHAQTEYSYKWISQSSYVQLYPEEETQFWVLIENTGQATWDKNLPIHLGTDRQPDRQSIFYDSSDWLTTNRAGELTEDTVVPPGGRAVFLFNIIAPNQPGTHREYFRPVIENVSWLEDYGIYWDITVKPKENETTIPNDSTDNYITDGSYRSQLLSPDVTQFTLAQGDSKNLHLQIKNVGTATWYNDGPSPIHLATARDWDRTSIFYNNSWLSQNRTTAINESNVPPSQNASYNLVLTAPTNAIPGIYSESFQSVAENITWFMDYDITYEITVRSSDPKYGEIVRNNTIDQFLSSGHQITITDLASGQSLQVKTISMDRWHADVVPLTTNDTAIIREIYNYYDDFHPGCTGDDWILWQPNAVTVQIDTDSQSRKIAASMDGCAHDVNGGITDNGFPGHFDLHFYESMMHGKEEFDCSFQKMVQKAAGNPNWPTYGQADPCWNPCVGGGC
ncbi:MAG: hypothetical protein WC570_01485 [Patescibacteria group bacterium]